MRAVSNWTRAYLGLIAFSALGLAASRALGRDPGWIAPLAAGLTLVIGLVAVFRSMAGQSGAKIVLPMAALLTLGSAVELIGASTGVPFGHYAYTDRWRPVIMVPGVGWFPLLLPAAWALMIGGATMAVLRYRQGQAAAAVYALLAGLLAATIDLGMEPVMTGSLGYWRWTAPGPLPGGASLWNPVGWFIFSTVGAAILLAAGVRAAWRAWDATVVLTGHVALLAWIAVLGRY